MLDLSPDKIFMLAVVALVVLGPNRLPGAARSLGRLIAQLRSMSSSLQNEVREVLHDPEDAFSSALAEFHPAQVRRSVRKVVTDTLLPLGPAGSPGPTTSPSSTNMSPEPGSSTTPVASAEVAGPSAEGWGGRRVPDDPGFN